LKDRLDVFYAVAERLNFTQAAQALFISQPAVSAAIKALETEYGLPLFSRAGGHIELTEAGQVLLTYVKQMKSLEGAAARELGILKGDVSGRLHIGASTTIAQYVLPRLLNNFKASLSTISFTLTAQITELIAEQLRAGKVDVALVEGVVKGTEFKSTDWIPDPLHLYVAAHHDWANKAIKFEELLIAPLLIREVGSGHHQTLIETFKNKHIDVAELNVVLELGSTEAIKLAVEENIGCAFLSEWAILKELALGTLAPVKIDDFEMNRTFHIVQTKDSENNALVQRFVQQLHKVAKRLEKQAASAS
jgi:LysR family transcriptional regulator, transcriptional activator of the cysJI operon